MLENALDRIDNLQTHYITGKIPPEATFKGNDYLSYDLVRLGGEPIVSTKDSIALDFKTNRPDGLLFYTGYTTPDDLIF